MKTFKFFSFAVILLLAFHTGHSQEASKTVQVNSSGSGSTQEEAKQNALRSAIEQAFGAFISSKTEVLNDKIVSDQITSVSSGNIQSFEIISEKQFSNGQWNTAVKAIISIEKLTSFVQSKGIEIEVKGGLFALNIKQQILNEQGEIKSVENLVSVLHEQMQTAFDYEISSKEPVAKDADSKNWEIPLEIKVIANKNMDIAATYAMKTLRSIALTKQEIESYEALKKEIFPICITYGDELNLYFFRKKETIATISRLKEFFHLYTQSFVCETGFYKNLNLWETDYIYGKNNHMNKLLLLKNENEEREDKYYNPSEYISLFYKKIDLTTDTLLPIEKEKFGKNKNNKLTKIDNIFDQLIKKDLVFLLPYQGELVATKIFNDKKTLSELEKITGYKVTPSPVRSRYYKGTLSAILPDNKEIWFPLKSDTLNDDCDYELALKKTTEFNLNHFTDWRLPTADEVTSINYFMVTNKIKSERYLSGNGIWTSTQGKSKKNYYVTDLNVDQIINNEFNLATFLEHSRSIEWPIDAGKYGRPKLGHFFPIRQTN